MSNLPNERYPEIPENGTTQSTPSGNVVEENVHRERRRGCLGATVGLLVLLLALGGLGWYGSKQGWELIGLIKGKITTVSGIRFETFHIEAGSLRFGEVSRTEEFKRKDYRRLLGTTVSSIRVDASHVFTIPLERRRQWRVNADHNRRIITVVVPPPEPMLPVALHWDTLEEKTSSGWLRWNKKENLEELRRDLTRQLEKRARCRHLRNQARQPARTAVAEFVRDTLRTSQHPVHDYTVQVRFSDEMTIVASLPTR